MGAEGGIEAEGGVAKMPTRCIDLCPEELHRGPVEVAVAGIADYGSHAGGGLQGFKDSMVGFLVQVYPALGVAVVQHFSGGQQLG